ncbi:MAG: hypothetical protein NVS4B12_12070 [Ktedonobacteraceae bacterium]
MIAGPGAAYICDACLLLCNDILTDSTSFSTKALELASRPPVVIAAPREQERPTASAQIRGPLRTLTVEMEQKQQDMTLILHQIQFYQAHFELRYLWIRPPFTTGFAFVPRIIFFLEDSVGTQWKGERSGMLLSRPDLASGQNNAVYQGSARFQPSPSPEARTLTVRAIDPLRQFEEEATHPWQFEITLQVI